MFKQLIIAGLIVSVFLLACGPTAIPDGGGGSSKSADAEPTPTSTPWPTKPTVPPKTAQPTKPPLMTPTPEPGYEPPPAHPEGLEGCKAYGLFGSPEEIAYFEWCSEQVTAEVKSGCSGLDTENAQLACGEEIVAEYKSFSIREGPFKCKGLSSGSQRLEQCLLTSVEDIDKAFIAIYEAWGKVRARGDADSEVGTALKDTIKCLEDMGHEDIDADLLFGWQRFEHPVEHKARKDSLTQEDKDSITELHEPSRDCAKKNGLFTAQDTAWIAELERLDQDEPETVDILIQEGLLEALKKPGVEPFLTGDRPSP